MHQWQTLWSIAGPKLPKERTRITDDILIRPRTFREATEKSPSMDIDVSLSASSKLYVVHYPPRDEVQGSHRVQIDTEAETEDEAISLAKQVCERLTDSLSLVVSDAPYFAQLLKYRRSDEVEEYSDWQTANISPLTMPAALDVENLELGLRLINILEDDKTANNAYIHLSTAWKLQSIAGSKPLERSILQHYALCVEAIVNGTMRKVRTLKKDAIDLEEKQFAKEFSRNLPKRADKATAIRDASTKLREISLTNMIPSIDAIRPVIGLTEDVYRDAKNLYRLRSSNLSHPGMRNNDQIHRWLNSGSNINDICLADNVARTFLLKYCNHVSS